MNESPEAERSNTLFLAITFPDDGTPSSETDAEQVADELVHVLNEERYRNGCPFEERLMVHAIPVPQWLTRRTLANLKAAAQGQLPEILAELLEARDHLLDIANGDMPPEGISEASPQALGKAVQLNTAARRLQGAWDRAREVLGAT